MAQKVMKQPPGPRDQAAKPGELAPGLYEGEAAFELEDGTLVAVAVDTEWLPNGEGMVGIVRSRWIDAEGVTQTCPHGHHVAKETRHTFSATYVERFGPDLLAKQLLLLALGEEPDTVEHTNPDQSTFAAPVIALGEEARLQGSMRKAVAMAKSAKKKGDPVALLAVKAPAKAAKSK